MKFVTFQRGKHERLGAIADDRIVDLTIAGIADSMLDMILGDSDPVAVAKASGDPALQSIEAQEGEGGGLSLTAREQLDAVIQLHLDNKLSLMGIVMYASDDPKAATPARIIYVDGEYREE